MSQLKNDKEQYEKYLSGKLSGEEANAFEREVLNDPFEQEALEGFESAEAGALADIEELQTRVLKKKGSGFGWMRIAAVVALLIVGSFTVWLLNKPIAAEQELAQQTPELEEEAEQYPEEKLSTAVDPNEQLSADDQERPLAEVDREVAEARKIELVEVETEELFFEEEATEVALTDDFSDDSIESDIAELQIDADDMGDVALAMENDTQALQSGAPIAFSKTAEFSSDTLNSITLGQNLVSEAEVLEEVVVATELSVSDQLKGTVSGVKIENATSRAKRKAPTERRAFASDATLRTITGQITDDAGESLPGVNVVIKGTTTGVTSDLDGNYSLSVSPGAVLVISFVGFESHEIEVGGRSVVDVTLGGVTELQEVVVTGYGVQPSASQSYEPPAPYGGIRFYKKWLRENLKYPKDAENNNVAGVVVLELTISFLGEVSNIEVKKSVGFGCDKEAIRLVENGPEWKAAKRAGSGIEDKVKLRIRFKN